MITRIALSLSGRFWTTLFVLFFGAGLLAPDARAVLSQPPPVQENALLGAGALKRYVHFSGGISGSTFTVSRGMLNGAASGWLSVTGIQGATPASPAGGTGAFSHLGNAVIELTLSPSALPAAGVHQGALHLNWQGATVTVNVTLTLSQPRPRILTTWNSVVLQAVEHSAGPPQAKFRIFNGSPGNMNWTIAVEGEASWLNISPTTGLAGPSGSTVTVGVLNPQGLSNNVYTAVLKITAPNAVNSPHYVVVTYYAVRITASPVPLLNGYGIFCQLTTDFRFSAQPCKDSDLTIQTFGLTNTGGGEIHAMASASVPGLPGVSVSQATEPATPAGGPNFNISILVGNTQPGFYSGKITIHFTDIRNNAGVVVPRNDQEIDIAVLVLPGLVFDSFSLGPNTNHCTPTSMNLLSVSIGNGLNAPVSFPQVLLAQLIDDCGSPVTSSTVVGAAEGFNIPMPESGNGFYSGNWTPQTVSAATPVTFAAFHPLFAPVQKTFTVATVPTSGGLALPVLFNSGVVEGAGFTANRPLAPGGIISLFGSTLAPNIANAANIPLERALADTSVRIGNVEAPLYFVSPGQINAQLPFEAQPGDVVSILVRSGNRFTAPQNYQVAAAQPGIFVSGPIAAVLNSVSNLVTQQNPARIGEVIQIFSTGLGRTQPLVDSGAGGPPFSQVEVPVSVTVGGLPASVVFQGLAPNFVGLYQVNVIVPQGITPGPSVPLVITQDGIASNPNLPASLPIAP